MPDVTIDFGANLREAQEAFRVTALSVKTLDQTLAALTRVAEKAAQRLEDAGTAKATAAKQGGQLDGALNGLIGRFTAIVSVASLAHQAFSYVSGAIAEQTQRAALAAGQLKELQDVMKQLAGASDYNLANTLANRQLGLRLGVEAKTDPGVALGVTQKGLREGFGERDILAALNYQRVSNVSAEKLFEVSGKIRDATGGTGIGGEQLVNLLLALEQQTKESPDEVLDLLDKVASAAAHTGVGVQELTGVAFNTISQLPSKKAAGAISQVLAAVSKSYEYTQAPSAAEILTAARTGRAAPPIKGTRLPQGTTLAERVADIPTDELLKLVEDPEAQIVLEAIIGGKAPPITDLLGPATRARNADPLAQPIDEAAAAASAVALSELEQGATFQRVETKRRLLIAALWQAGKSPAEIKFRTSTVKDIVELGTFGDLGAVEQAIESEAATAGVSLDPTRVRQGTAGLKQIGEKAFITPERYRRIRSGDEYDPRDIRLNDYLQELIDATKANGEGIKIISYNRGPNGSLRDWRGDDFLTRNNYPDRSGKFYLGGVA